MGIVQKDGIKIALISYGGAVLGLINKMLLFPLFLDTAEVGLANLLINVAVLIASLSMLGTQTVMLRYLPPLRGKAMQIGNLMWWLTLITTAGFLLVTLLLILFKEPLQVYYGRHSPLLVDYYYYLIPFGAVTLYFFFFDNYLRALFKTVVPVFFFEVLLRLFVMASTVLYVVADLRFDQFVLLYLLSHCTPTILILIYGMWLRKLHIRPGRLQMSPGEKRGMFSYGAFAFINSSGLVLMATLDSVLVAGFLGLSKTGIYTTMFFFVSMLMIPYRAIIKIAGPIVSENWERGDMAAMGKLYKQVTASNIVVGSVIFTLMWINIDLAFSFMPPAYASGRWALFFMSLGRLFDMFTGVNGLILITSPRFKVDVGFSIVLMALLVVMIPGFIFLFDMEGAAIGTSLAIILYNSSRLLYIHRVFKLQPFESKPLLLLAFAALPIVGNEFFAPIAIDLGLVMTTVLKTGVVGAYFLAILYWLRPAEEINRVFDRLLKRR